MSSLHPFHVKARLGSISLAAGLALSASAHAESGTEPGNLQLYLGGGGGASPMTLDSRDYSATGTFMMQNPGSGYEISQDSTYAGSYKAFVGLRFLKFFAIEAGVAHLGTVGFTAEWASSGLTYTDRGDYSAAMSYVAGLLTLPMGSDGSYFHVKGGAAQVKVDLTETLTLSNGFSTSESVHTSSVKQSRPLVGIGYTSPTGPRSQFRVEVEHLGEIGTEYVFQKSPGRASVTMVTASFMVAF